MFGMTKPKSKFGSMLPGAMEPPYGTPPIVPTQRMAEEGAAAPAPEPRKPGFFKPGGAGQYVFAALADTLARQMDEQPTAVAGIMQQQARAQELAERQRMASAERENDWADWLKKKEWERDNPEPRVNDTVADFEWFKGLSPADRALYEQMRPVYRQGPDGQFYRVQPQQDAPDTLPADFDFGGPTPPASGGFPRR